MLGKASGTLCPSLSLPHTRDWEKEVEKKRSGPVKFPVRTQSPGFRSRTRRSSFFFDVAHVYKSGLVRCATTAVANPALNTCNFLSLSFLLSKDWILFIVNCVCKTAFELFAISYEFKITRVGTKTLYTSYPKRSALRTPYKSLSFEKRNLKSFFWKIVRYANKNQWIRSTNFFEKWFETVVWSLTFHYSWKLLCQLIYKVYNYI